MLIIKDSHTEHTATVTKEGYFLVDELDLWIDTLQHRNDGIFKDPKTGNKYIIRKV